MQAPTQRTSHERREAHQRLAVHLRDQPGVEVSLGTRDDWAGLESELVVVGAAVPAAVCDVVATLGLGLRAVTPQGDHLVVVVQ